MIILITGASGFLGVNLLSTMARSHPEARLIACDVMPPGPLELLAIERNPVEYHPLDVSNREACLRLLREVRPTHVVHAAAVTSTTSVETVLAVNLHGTCHIMEAAIAVGTVQRLVFLSSSGVYCQTNDSRSCREDGALQLDTSYALYKRQAELHLIAHRHEVDVVIARVGPAFGPYERPRVSRPTTSLIYQLVDAWRTGCTLKIVGTDTTRDWTYATDISGAIDRLLICTNLKHDLYNVSCGVPTSARTIIANMIGRGLEVIWQHDITTADHVLDPTLDRKPLDITRLQNDTDFQPRFSIDAGLDSLLGQCPVTL
jgi:UDP-glucose 4-epimerase